MKAIALFFLFLGVFLITQGYYSQKTVCEPPKEVIKYVPLSVYEDQLSGEERISKQFKSMFEDTSPWPAALG